MGIRAVHGASTTETGQGQHQAATATEDREGWGPKAKETRIPTRASLPQPRWAEHPGLLHANHPGAGRTGGSNHLVTRAEMMSVIVALTSASISSTGPGMGSCWQRCSALRICCRFCQMISANFSHLHGSPRPPGGQWYHPTPQARGREAPVWGERPKTQFLPPPGRFCTSATTPDPKAECPPPFRNTELRGTSTPEPVRSA